MLDLTVIRYVDDSSRAAVENSKDHVLALMRGVLRRDKEEFVRSWVEDENGKVLESHADFSPTKPTMWS